MIRHNTGGGGGGDGTVDINGLTALGAAPASNDQFIIYDTDAGENKKLAVSNLAIGDAFTTIQCDAGTDPVATTSTDTLTMTSSDSHITITGDSGSKQVDFTIGANVALLSGRSGGQTLYGGTDASDDLILDSTSHATKSRVIVDGGSRLDVGDTTLEASGVNINGTTYATGLRVNDFGGTRPAQLMLHRHSTTYESVVVGSRSNSDTTSHTAVTNDQNLLTLYGAGWTGSHYDLFGAISIGVDATGTISSTSSPGQIRFYTTADGSNSLTERMSIDNAGDVHIPGYNLITDSGELSNIRIGDGAGDSITSGINDVLVGQNAGTALTSGSYHVAIGYGALAAKTTEATSGTVAIGWEALNLCTTGVGNVCVGVRAGRGLTAGGSNVAIGRDSLRNITDGTIQQNVAIGYNSGLSSSGGWCVYVGANAGRYNTADHRLFVNPFNQVNEAGDKANSLIYGEFNLTAADQILSTPGKFGVGIQAPLAKAHIDQESTTAAIPVLTLDQGDIDDTFINFIGTTAADGTRSISTDTTEDSAKYGAVRVEINGTTKWIRIYDDES